MTQNGIKNSWSLMAFVRNNGGHLSIGTCTNSESGDSFKSMSVHDGTRDANGKLVNSKLVNFSSNLGELSNREIVEMKDQLQVVELNVAPEVLERRLKGGKQLESYKLCKIGENSWQEVDLGI